MNFARLRHASSRGLPAQGGLASLEFILALPVLVFLVLLLVNVVSLAKTRLDVIVTARTVGFEEAYRLSTVYRMAKPAVAANGEPIFVSVAQKDLSERSKFLPWLRERRSDQAERTGALERRSNGRRIVNSPHVAEASAFYFGDRPLGLFDFVVEEGFATFAQPIWERADMPLGYDHFLDRIPYLNEALPHAFPRTP